MACVLAFPLAVLAEGGNPAGQPPAAVKEDKPKSAEPPAKENLSAAQQQLADEFAELQGTLMRMHDLLRPSDPNRASLLEKAVKESGDRQVENRFREIINLLSQEKQLAEAARQQDRLNQDLEAILQLLMNEDRSKRLQDEKARIRNYLERINQIARQQKDLHGRAAGDEDPKSLSENQGGLAQKTGNLAKEIRGADQKSHGAGKDDKSDPKGGGKSDGKSKSGDGKDSKSDGKDSKSDGKDSKSDGKDPKSDGKNSKSDGKDSKSDGKDSKSDGKNSKSDGKGKDGEGGKSPSKSSPSQGDSQEGGKNQGKPSQGQGQGQSQGQGQDPPKDQSQNPDGANNPAQEDTPQKRLESAKSHMEEAKKRLDKAKKEGAREEQEKALRDLEAAKAKLEEILRQLREEELRRMLVALQARFQKVLIIQREIHEATVRLEKVPVAERSHGHELETGRLSNREADIVVEVDRALSLLREEGSSVAMPEAVQQIRDDMQQIVHRLAQGKTEILTQTIETDVIRGLEEILDALKKAEKELDKRKKPPGPSPTGQPQEPPLIELLAELKMIRALQMRVNLRTERYSKLIQGEQAEKNDVLEALQRLSDQQRRVYKVTRDLEMGKNE